MADGSGPTVTRVTFDAIEYAWRTCNQLTEDDGGERLNGLDPIPIPRELVLPPPEPKVRAARTKLSAIGPRLRKPKRWTVEMERRVDIEYAPARAAGMLDHLANSLGVTRQGLEKRAHLRGVTRRRGGPRQDTAKARVMARLEGKTWKHGELRSIAAELHISYESLRTYVKELGIKRVIEPLACNRPAHTDR